MRENIEGSDGNVLAREAFAPTSLVALRSWLQSQRSGYASQHAAPNAEIRTALRLVCNDVRGRGIRVEQLIIVLKEQWNLIGEQAGGTPMRSRETLDTIIRACIDEFYAPLTQSKARDSDERLSL